MTNQKGSFKFQVSSFKPRAKSQEPKLGSLPKCTTIFPYERHLECRHPSMLKRILVIVIVIVVVLCGLGVARYRDCHQRGEAFRSRVNSIKHAAELRLPIGATKEDVVHFFADVNFPLHFDEVGASGTIYTTGCSPFGCAKDSAMIQIQVAVDSKGTVQSKPLVRGGYTDCI